MRIANADLTTTDHFKQELLLPRNTGALNQRNGQPDHKRSIALRQPHVKPRWGRLTSKQRAPQPNAHKSQDLSHNTDLTD